MMDVSIQIIVDSPKKVDTSRFIEICLIQFQSKLQWIVRRKYGWLSHFCKSNPVSIQIIVDSPKKGIVVIIIKEMFGSFNPNYSGQSEESTFPSFGEDIGNVVSIQIIVDSPKKVKFLIQTNRIQLRFQSKLQWIVRRKSEISRFQEDGRFVSIQIIVDSPKKGKY